jgi:hypothetical protein
MLSSAGKRSKSTSCECVCVSYQKTGSMFNILNFGLKVDAVWLETSSLDMILLLTFKIHWSKDDIIHIVIITSMMSIILYRWANPLDLTRDSSPGQIGYSASLKKFCHSKVWRKIIQSLPVLAENAIIVTYHTNQMGICRANVSNERGEQPSAKTPKPP